MEQKMLEKRTKKIKIGEKELSISELNYLEKVELLALIDESDILSKEERKWRDKLKLKPLLEFLSTHIKEDLSLLVVREGGEIIIHKVINEFLIFDEILSEEEEQKK